MNFFPMLNELAEILKICQDEQTRLRLENMSNRISDIIHDQDELVNLLETSRFVFCQRYSEDFFLLDDDFVVLSHRVEYRNGQKRFINLQGKTENGLFKPISALDQINFNV
jgi:hypothetical protein